MDNISLKNVAAVIRSYNNPSIVKQVKRLVQIGINHIYVVTNATSDRQSTNVWLKESGLVDDVSVIEMWDQYHWSTALNAALCNIGLHNLSVEESMKIRFCFNVSVEALFEKSHLEQMLTAFQDERTAIVGTSFHAQSHGNSIDTGRSYRHPRNTGMLIDIGKLGCGQPLFDPFCDGVGGMEDIDFVFRTIAFSGYRTKMIEAKVPLIVGVHYNQAQKEEREQAAMDKIIARWRACATIGTNLRNQIDRVVESMGLEGSEAR